MVNQSSKGTKLDKLQLLGLKTILFSKGLGTY